MGNLVIRLLLLVCVALLALPGVARGAPSGASSGLERFLQVETSAPVFDVNWKYGSVSAAPNGAYGPNVTAPRSAWFIEYQRAGAGDVMVGVLRHEPQTLAVGLRMFHFGLAREANNGSFPGSAWPFHGTAMFLSEAAPSLLVLKASSYAVQFAHELQWDTGRMRRAAYYMVHHVGGPGKIDDHTKNHRFYEAAIALGSVSMLSGDRTLKQWSTRYAWEGVRMERPDGVMPEDGGHDSGYQALGMVSASRYLTLIATGRIQQSLNQALRKGEAWEISRVRSDGSINQSGDTRTAGCRERNPVGVCKSVMYAPIFNALARWAAISGDQRYAQTALRVWRHSQYGG